ncbi:MAG TPA: acyl-CoA dehydrogenase family protein [Mycobacteriales bacterium]|nr:acyl-CoA dehydrogenase family protein [Mycobacteriales bacterium]
MDFRLSSDQSDLRDAVKAMLSREVTSELIRERYATDGSGEKARADGLWKLVTDAHWTALGAPEEAGGFGLGAVELGLLCEQAGYYLAPIPLWETAALAVPLLGRALEGGERATAVTHVGTITPDAGGRLSGPATLVPEAHVSDLIVVPTAQGTYVVETSRAQILVHDCTDKTRILSEVTLEGVAAEKVSDVAPSLDLATVTLAAQTLGSARRLLDMTVDYVKVREQFDRPIGTFQAVQHKLADVLVAIERAWSATFYAAMCIDARNPDAARATCIAKAATGDASRLAAREASQCHGGIGYTWEHDLHLWFRRIFADEPLLGGSDVQRDRLADLLAL